MFEYHIKITRVVDGDTVDCSIDLGFDIHTHKRIRLYGINAPESRTSNKEEKQRGMAAKYRLMELIDSAEEIRLISHGKGKFGRVIGELLYNLPNESKWINISEQMIQENHAVPYFGEKRS